MSTCALNLVRECLICGNTEARHIRQMTLKEGAQTRSIYFVLCDDHTGPTSDEIFAGMRDHPDRWKTCNVRDLDVSNPDLSQAGYIKIKT